MVAKREPNSGTRPLFQGLQGWHGFLLRKAGQRFTEQAEQALVHLNITLRQFGVLNVVDSEPGINQRMVGQTLRIDRTTIVGLVDDLEQKNLLERRRGADRRTFALYLTDRGTVCLRDAGDLMVKIHESFLQPLSVAERDVLRELLQRLAVADDSSAL
ncbi:MarR family winged helix-turn-helix transcriptional regulator [Streptomyces sp. NPDC059994]|uniref:MarR family winged helix-turn-helix transcriptional regulator n=1 Tax=Streptomyces sp. NPDC059994 TaxID=3347029 RepID=UPI0036CEE619